MKFILILNGLIPKSFIREWKKNRMNGLFHSFGISGYIHGSKGTIGPEEPCWKGTLRIVQKGKEKREEKKERRMAKKERKIPLHPHDLSQFFYQFPLP